MVGCSAFKSPKAKARANASKVIANQGSYQLRLISKEAVVVEIPDNKRHRRDSELQPRGAPRNRVRERKARGKQTRTQARHQSDQATCVRKWKREESEVAKRNPRAKFFEERLGSENFLDNQDRGGGEHLLHQSKLAITSRAINDKERAGVPTREPKRRKFPGRPGSNEARESRGTK